MVKLLPLLLAACTSWSVSDVALESGVLASTTVDWVQTETYVSQCRELNPLIGPCGNRVPPSFYFPAVMLAHLFVANYLPKGPFRTTWIAFWLGVEMSTVVSNFQTK